MIVVYKFGTRCNGILSPREGVKVHLLHAEAHNGKVLFTTGKGPSPQYRDQIEKIILTTADGSFAVSATVDDLGKTSIMNAPADYEVPSLWSDKNLAWFALSDVKQIEGGIKRGEYACVTGKDLLDSISGNAYMVYVNENAL